MSLRTYAKFGYKTLVIWEKELKDMNNISKRIHEFQVL